MLRSGLALAKNKTENRQIVTIQQPVNCHHSFYTRSSLSFAVTTNRFLPYRVLRENENSVFRLRRWSVRGVKKKKKANGLQTAWKLIKIWFFFFFWFYIDCTRGGVAFQLLPLSLFVPFVFVPRMINECIHHIFRTKWVFFIYFFFF